MAARELDGQRTTLVVRRIRVRGLRSDRRADVLEPRGERPREVRVVWRASRLRHHEASTSVPGHVAAFGDPDVDPGLRAAELFPHQIEESERILPHELRDFRRRHGQQCAAFGDRLPHAVAAETLQCLLEGVVAKQEQLPVGQPADVLGRVHRAAVDARDFRRFSKRVDPCVDLLVVVADRLSCGRAEDDVELIEAAEARQEGTKRGDRPAVARQKAEHVGVEPQTLYPDERRDHEQKSRHGNDRAVTSGPRQDGCNGGRH